MNRDTVVMLWLGAAACAAILLVAAFAQDRYDLLAGGIGGFAATALFALGHAVRRELRERAAVERILGELRAEREGRLP